mmetsp:Transcript_2243/g.4810  ORF Transcript_2243/g.4810 Transcript_2243/m.4810 type:complete len:339 (+) Transcript_2243:1233-2249(+)
MGWRSLPCQIRSSRSTSRGGGRRKIRQEGSHDRSSSSSSLSCEPSSLPTPLFALLPMPPIPIPPMPMPVLPRTCFPFFCALVTMAVAFKLPLPPPRWDVLPRMVSPNLARRPFRTPLALPLLASPAGVAAVAAPEEDSNPYRSTSGANDPPRRFPVLSRTPPPPPPPGGGRSASPSSPNETEGCSAPNLAALLSNLPAWAGGIVGIVIGRVPTVPPAEGVSLTSLLKRKEPHRWSWSRMFPPILLSPFDADDWGREPDPMRVAPRPCSWKTSSSSSRSSSSSVVLTSTLSTWLLPSSPLLSLSLSLESSTLSSRSSDWWRVVGSYRDMLVLYIKFVKP